MAGGQGGGEGAGGTGMRRWRRGQACTVAGGRVLELLQVALRQTCIGAAHGHRGRRGAPCRHVGGEVDALSPHHHGALLVRVLLPLAQVVVEVLALTLGQHLSVEISLQVRRHQQAGQVLQ